MEAEIGTVAQVQSGRCKGIRLNRPALVAVRCFEPRPVDG